MICDWYQATISDNYQNVMGYISNNLNGKWKAATSGQMGYENRLWFNDNFDITVATLLFGSKNPNQQNPHLYSSAQNAQDVMNLLRLVYPNDHVVTRIDVAEDMNEDGLFDELQGRLMAIANKERLKTSVAGDWLTQNAPDGRTMYLGSPKSSMRVRLYEKGKQLANEMYISKGFQPPSDFPINWVRLEAQCRPQKQQRISAATAELTDIWGFSKWTQTVADDVLKLSVPRVKADVWHKSNDEQVFEWVARQYGNFFVRQFEKYGSWSDVGTEIGKYVEAYIQARNNAAKG